MELQPQIEFARHNFENHQALIRFADTKAAAIITIVIFLGASGLQISKDAASRLDFHRAGISFVSALFIGSCVTFLLSFLWCLATVQTALKPRAGSAHRNPQPGIDLLWQDHVIIHQTPARYFDAVKNANAELLLQNLTDQIFELAHISSEKMAAIHQSRRACWWAAGAWIVNMVTALTLLKWK